MSKITLDAVYHQAYGSTGVVPFPFQRAIADRPDADMLIAPTGLGKTAAVTLAWIWQRLTTPETTPRRLIWCLPMRTLVEQTAREAQGWMDRLSGMFPCNQRKPSVHLILGGAVDADWRPRPEAPAIIVGTQDMLLSRALMRGYGMARFGWPIDYGLLHTDALWVYDEVQLMGAGLATSAQLEAFRRLRRWRHPGLARSLWVSATLNPAWLRTAEFRAEIPNPVVLRWDDGAPPEPSTLSVRLDAIKRLHRAQATVTAESVTKPHIHSETLAQEVASRHRQGTTTLVIVNTVRRAQALYAALKPVLNDSTARLLIHSRYRPPERGTLEVRLRDGAATDRVVVATQAVEAGIDMTSAVLFTELAPWSSMVQRFGRCNRAGERNADGGAEVYWINVETDGADAAARPYEIEELTAARDILTRLEEVSPRHLPPPSPPPPANQVIRPKDFEELFDTDADLSGYDLDVSPYIRDGDDMSVSLFWRVVGDAEHVTAERPRREELCPAPLNNELRSWLTSRAGAASAYIEDPLASDRSSWVRLDRSGRRLRPGLTLLLDVAMGGYDVERGFLGAEAKAPVEQVTAHDSEGAQGNDTDVDTTTDDDRQSFGFREAVPLERHLREVTICAGTIVGNLGLPLAEANALIRAGAWHDVGKAYAPFQTLLGRGAPDGPLLAKSAEGRAPAERCGQAKADGLRKYFRHELASALAFLQQHDGEPDADLVAFLIAAHHGKVRMGLRALSDERSLPGIRLARGVQDGDALPGVQCVDEFSSPMTLDLSPMEMGEDALGRPSWAARMQDLLGKYGPFRLAYLEALLRMADWRSSATGSDKDGSR